MDAARFVVVGSTEAARRTCTLLARPGVQVHHLAAPTDDELRAVLAGPVDGVAVLVRDDIAALRYCLAVEHVAPGRRMFVAVFDRTVARQLTRTIPACEVMSPADVAVPSLLGPCLDADLAALRRAGEGLVAARGSSAVPYQVPAGLRRAALLGLLRGQLRPHDESSRMLLLGLLGLNAVLVVDWALSVLLLGETPVDALFHAARTVATVGPASGSDAPAGYQLFAVAAMLLTILLTAAFTAGTVQRLLSPRLVALLGRRALPRSGHVVVAGLGQVGLRLCQELHALGLTVVAVERDARAPGVRLARETGIPVVVGDASSRGLLERVGARRALSLAAVASDDLDNISVCVAARAVAPWLRIVMRAGDHDAIAETRSLFSVAIVRDVNALTAAFVAQRLLRAEPNPDPTTCRSHRRRGGVPGTVPIERELHVH